MRKFPLLSILVFCASWLVSHAQLSTNRNNMTPQAPVISGLIGLWHLDGNTNDSSGFGHNGTIVGTVTQTAGRCGNAYHFDGSSYIDCGNVDLNSTGEFSISAWVKSTDPYVEAVWRMVVSKLDYTAGGPLELFLGDGRNESGLEGTATNYLAWNGGNGLYYTFSPYDLTRNAKDGNWHHLAVTFKSGSQIVYFDGVQVGSSTSSDPLPNTTSNFHIGGMDFGPYHHPLIGDIDEVSAYNRALSSSEIQTIAQGCDICANATNLTTTNITSTSAKLNWVASVNPTQWQIQYKRAIPDSPWVSIKLNGSARSVNIFSLTSNQTYKWRIRSKCGTTWNAYSAIVSFKTLAALQSISLNSTTTENLSSSLLLYPNPSKGEATIQYNSIRNEKIQLKVFDITGRVVFITTALSIKGMNTYHLNLSHFAGGIYYLELSNNNERGRIKFVIER